MNLKNQKGITGVDIAAAICILSIFTGILATLFYNIAVTNESVRRNATANRYIVAVIEEIQLSNYNDVTNDYVDSIIATMEKDFPGYTCVRAGENPEKPLENNSIINYKDTHPSAQDVIKKIRLMVTYSIGERIENVQITTLKTK